MVTVYSKENCQPCKMTKRALDRKGITYSEVKLEAAPEKAAEFAEQGYLAAPVVITETGTWCGYQPTKISELV